MSGAGFPGTVSLGHRAAHAAASSATSHLLQSWSSFRASIFGSVTGDLKKALHASNGNQTASCNLFSSPSQDKAIERLHAENSAEYSAGVKPNRLGCPVTPPIALQGRLQRLHQ